MTAVTIIGNLVDEPELRFTSGGKAVASFTVAESKRIKQPDGTWVDGPSTFWRCSIWESAAENMTESLHKGQRVIVVGDISDRSFETKQGEKRTVKDVTATEVGPSLKWATAKVEKTGGKSPRPKTNAPEPDPWGVETDEPPF
jgi:single-strand DNA-binding protein